MRARPREVCSTTIGTIGAIGAAVWTLMAATSISSTAVGGLEPMAGWAVHSRTATGRGFGS